MGVEEEGEDVEKHQQHRNHSSSSSSSSSSFSSSSSSVLASLEGDGEGTAAAAEAASESQKGRGEEEESEEGLWLRWAATEASNDLAASFNLGPAKILYGDLISVLIDFTVIALVVYFGVKLLGLEKLDKKKE